MTPEDGTLPDRTRHMTPVETPADEARNAIQAAEQELERFERVGRPMSGGGWFDPVHGSPQMPSGVSGEQWDAFVADCGNLGRGSGT